MTHKSHIKKKSIAQYLISGGWKLTEDKSPSSKRSHYGLCPFCGEGENRFQIFKNNYAYCRICETRGDIIDVVMMLECLTYEEACYRLNPTHSLPFRQLSPTPKVADFTDWQVDAERHWMECHQHLRDNVLHPAWDYLFSRGFTWSDIEVYGIGYAERWKRTASGFVCPAGITLPWLGANNRCFAINVYLDRWGRNTLNERRKFATGSKPKNGFFGSHLDNEGITNVVILEGEFDNVTVNREKPYQTILQLNSIGADSIPDDLSILDGRHIWHMSDGNEAGRKSFVRWSKRVPTIKQIPMPNDHDPNSYHLAGHSLSELLNKHIIRQPLLFSLGSLGRRTYA